MKERPFYGGQMDLNARTIGTRSLHNELLRWGKMKGEREVC